VCGLGLGIALVFEMTVWRTIVFTFCREMVGEIQRLALGHRRGDFSGHDGSVRREGGRYRWYGEGVFRRAHGAENLGEIVETTSLYMCSKGCVPGEQIMDVHDPALLLYLSQFSAGVNNLPGCETCRSRVADSRGRPDQASN
jgi:hypothetical protein